MVLTSQATKFAVKVAAAAALIRTGTNSENFWFNGSTVYYNLDNWRDPRVVTRELDAIADILQPLEIIVSEAFVRGGMPVLDGYWTLSHTPSDDLPEGVSLDSRRNIVTYIRSGVRHSQNESWLDLDEQWKRSSGPGLHPARSHMRYGLGRQKRLAIHQPPNHAAGPVPQREGYWAFVREMAPWKGDPDRWEALTLSQKVVETGRPQACIGDFNGRATERDDTNPGWLARMVDGNVVPENRIDAFVYRGQMQVTGFQVLEKVGGVPLRSDHGHCLLVNWRVPKIWMPVPPGISR